MNTCVDCGMRTADEDDLLDTECGMVCSLCLGKILIAGLRGDNSAWQAECQDVIREIRRVFPDEEMPVSAKHAAQKATAEIERLRKDRDA